jgi:predicted peroxiredoxin
MESSKLVIINTIGPENHEKATLPFVLATVTQSLDVDVVMFLQSSAVILAKDGEAEKVFAEGFLPLKEMLDTFLDGGGKLNLCSPCLKSRNIAVEELIKGAEIVAAGSMADEVMSANQVVTY